MIFQLGVPVVHASSTPLRLGDVSGPPAWLAGPKVLNRPTRVCMREPSAVRANSTTLKSAFTEVGPVDLAGQLRPSG